MEKISFLIRKITIPPVFAAAVLVLTFILRREEIGSAWNLFSGLLFLSVLPVLAYPMQKYIKGFKEKGREGQRTLAMIFSFVGYLAAVICAFSMGAPEGYKIICLEYLLCGIFILLFNKLLKMKASGHACGIVGPVLLLIYFGMLISAAVGLLFVSAVFYSSIKTKRHTSRQLIGGGCIAAVALLLIATLFWLV